MGWRAVLWLFGPVIQVQASAPALFWVGAQGREGGAAAVERRQRAAGRDSALVLCLHPRICAHEMHMLNRK